MYMTFWVKLRHKTVKTIYDACKGTAFNEKCEIWKNNFLNYIEIKSEYLLLVKNIFLLKNRFLFNKRKVYLTFAY